MFILFTNKTINNTLSLKSIFYLAVKNSINYHRLLIQWTLTGTLFIELIPYYLPEVSKLFLFTSGIASGDNRGTGLAKDNLSPWTLKKAKMINSPKESVLLWPLQKKVWKQLKYILNNKDLTIWVVNLIRLTKIKTIVFKSYLESCRFFLILTVLFL